MTVHPDPVPRAPDSDIFWRDLNYDIGWEATPDGVIRCRRVLNRRGDLFNQVEGLNLRDLSCDSRGKDAYAVLQEGWLVRHIEVRPPRPSNSEHLYLTGRILPDGSAVGTFCAVAAAFDDIFHGQLQLLSHVTDAREREEGHRQEADIMLQGLRILLGQATSGEKLKSLSSLMMDAIRGDAPLVLQVGRDGAIRPLSGALPSHTAQDALTELFQSQIAPVAVHRDGAPHIAELRGLLKMVEGDVAVIFLPVASGSIALVCCSRRAEGFLPEDIAFASRFALILKQALVLKDEQEKLIQSAKLSALGQMSASLAHELRQPLNTISVAAQNLEMMAENGPVAPESLTPKTTRILSQVDRASQIMDRIRRFSRKGEHHFARVDLVALVEGIRMLLEQALLPASIQLQIDIEDNLAVHCDGIQVEQVLVNLVNNAADALSGIGTARATEKGAVAVRGRRTENGIVLRVEDNGPGFPPDVVSRPLETFFTTKDAEKGTGLGLSICHMIAREHAGKLQIGNHDKGAYIELHIPERHIAAGAA